MAPRAGRKVEVAHVIGHSSRIWVRNLAEHGWCSCSVEHQLVLEPFLIMRVCCKPWELMLRASRCRRAQKTAFILARTPLGTNQQDDW